MCLSWKANRAVRTVIPSLPDFKTRDILTMWGTIEHEPFFFMVAHWPSRLGGKEASEFKRIAVGEQMPQHCRLGVESQSRYESSTHGRF